MLLIFLIFSLPAPPLPSFQYKSQLQVQQVDAGWKKEDRERRKEERKKKNDKDDWNSMRNLTFDKSQKGKLFHFKVRDNNAM